MNGFDDHVKPSKRVQVYAIFIAKHPCLCYVVSCTVMLTLAVIGFVVRDDYPDFNKADRGFEPRGTVIGGAQKAYERHLQDAQCNGQISSYPDGTRSWHRWHYNTDDDVANHRDFDKDGDADPAYCNIYAWPGYNASAARRGLEEEGRAPEITVALKEIDENFYNPEDYDSPVRDAMFALPSGLITPSVTADQDFEWLPEFVEEVIDQGSRRLQGWEETFCNSESFDIDAPTAINVVLRAKTPGTDLLSLEALSAICDLDKEIRDQPFFNPSYCTHQMDIDRTEQWNPVLLGRYCCKSRTLPNYVAQLANKDSCKDINATDVENFRQHLDRCANSYHVLDKLYACDTTEELNLNICKQTEDVPEECWQGNLAFDSFNALVDWRYTDPGNQTLTVTKIAIPLSAYNDDFLIGLHEEVLFGKHMTEISPGVELIAYDLGIKFDVFNKQLLSDGILAVFAFFVVFVMIRIHTGSMFISCLAYLEIMSALGVAYFLYMIVLGLPFFPFLNLVGIFIVIGIGADDVFVFVDAWKQAASMMRSGSDQVHKRMAWTLQRAGGAMFVTSTTTR